MILIENGLPLGDVNILGSRGFGPRKRDHPFQIGARDHVFRRSRSHLGQPLELAFALLERLGGHPGFFELLAKFVDFDLAVVGFSQFLVNRLELLAQQIFALALADLLLNLLLDLVAQLQNFEFLREFADERLKPSPDVRGLEQFLAKQRGKRRQIRRDEIGQTHRIVNVQRRGLQIVGKLRRTRHDVAEQLASIAFQRHQLGVMRTNQIGLDFHPGHKKWPEAQQLDDADPLQTLQEHHDVAIGHLHQFVDFRGGPHGVQVRGCRLLHARIVLRHDSEKLFITMQRIEQGKRSLAPNGKRLHPSRKQHDLPNRKDRQLMRNRYRFFSHWGPPKISPTDNSCTQSITLDAGPNQKVPHKDIVISKNL